MTGPQVHRYEDLGTLAGDVASRVVALLEDLQAAGTVPHVVLTGGSVAEEIHRELGRIGADSGVDWNTVEFWFSDERFVPTDSEERNTRQARAAFLDELGATRVHEVAASDAGLSVEQAAAAYGAEVRASDSHTFDLTVLGMGPDGHVGSIFPDHPAAEIDDIAVPVRHSPKPPPERVSLSTEALSRSERVWFVISGEAKREIAQRVRDGDTALPAARVGGRSETLWFEA